MVLMTGRMQGSARFDLYLDGEVLIVVDRQTGETIYAVKSKAENYKGSVSMKRWRIPWQKEKGTAMDVLHREGCRRLRTAKGIEYLHPEDQWLRNNIEATMFQ